MCQLFIILSLAIVLQLRTAFGTDVTKRAISSIFEGFGYSPVCVIKALTSCELSSVGNSSENITNSCSEAKAFVSMQDIVAEKKRARNCNDLLTIGDTSSGVRTVYPYDSCRDRKVMVYCDQITDGGGWTVFLNRDNLTIREDFYRTWIEYSLGFGNIAGEYWLGLDNIHALVGSTLTEMRADLEDYDGEKRWAKYGMFYVGDTSSKYKLSVGRYAGDAGDGFTYHTGMEFSTYDNDNDHNVGNEAVKYKGGHWYPSGHASNLNGFPHVGKYSSYADGIGWYHFRGHQYSLRRVSLKVRPSFRS